MLGLYSIVILLLLKILFFFKNNGFKIKDDTGTINISIINFSNIFLKPKVYYLITRKNKIKKQISYFFYLDLKKHKKSNKYKVQKIYKKEYDSLAYLINNILLFRNINWLLF
jgi:hypothetical protein